MCPGGPFCLFYVRSAQYGQLSSRRRWPATELEWKGAKPYSFWGPASAGVTSSSWRSFPEAGASALTPAHLEMEHTEVLINLPILLARPATAKRRLDTGGPPPPPPQRPEISWGAGASSANYAKSAPAPPDLFGEPGERYALQEFKGADVLGMFQGSQ